MHVDLRVRILKPSHPFPPCNPHPPLTSPPSFPLCSSGSNVTSVAEHSVMMHLSLVRNYLFAHEQVQQGGWDVSQIVKR